MNKEEKGVWVLKQIIDEMFLIAGHPDVTFEDIVNRKDNWWMEWSMTEDQYLRWKQAGIDILRREYRWPKYRASEQMAWYALQYSLTIK